MTTEPTYPEPDDSPLWMPFWAGVNEGRLSYMRCQACDYAFLPPRSECPNCLEPGAIWQAASGKAKLVSWVVYHAVADELFKTRLPYTVAIVELAEGPRMISNVVGVADPEKLRAEQRLELRIEQEATTAVPRFRAGGRVSNTIHFVDHATENMPLAGLTVLDFGQIYQGPYCGFLLAKAGADVIKIEPPGSGEQARQRIEVSLGASLPFEMLNANKRSISLNLKSEEGRRLLMDLVGRADILLENFAPGVMERLGVGWSVLHAHNPRLIYGSASGFGLSGPDRDKLAMDLTIQAVSGIMASTGFADGSPVKAGPAVADFMGGVHLYAAITTALVERARTGVGRLVEVSMLETIYPTLASTLGLLYEMGDDAAMRTGNRHSGLSMAPYNVYAAVDGHVAIICVQESHWQNLLTAMGREDLRGNPLFETHSARAQRIDETDAIVEAWTSAHTRDQLFDFAKRFHIPCAPVREVAEVVNDQHMHARGMLQRINHPSLGPVVMPNSPLRVHGADALAFQPARALGQDNATILGEWLGRSPEELADYARRGVI